MDHYDSDSPHMRYWQVKVAICEREEHTQARAVLRVDPVGEIEGSGYSTRARHDPSIPRIGDEVAVARALHALADRLLQTAAVEIERVTGELDVSLH